MKYLVNESTDPYFNMAFDEWCLENIDVGEPVFYLWKNRPSVIIGLNQNASQEVNLDYLRQNGITLARRVTGGGAVYHDLQNLNYSIIGRDACPEIFAEALRKLGIDAELTGRNDIFVGGKKVSGYAKRIWKDRVLIHGTLMYDVDIDVLTKALTTPVSKLAMKGVASVRSRVTNLKEMLPQFKDIDGVKEALHVILSDGDSQLVLNEKQLAEIRELSDAKFSTEAWLFREPKLSL